MITFALPEIDGLEPNDRCEAWSAIRKQVSIRLRRYDIEPTFAWVREVEAAGGVEHMHLMAHVPRPRRLAVVDEFEVWKKPPSINMTKWSEKLKKMPWGKWQGGVGYLIKHQDREASDFNKFDRVPGGSVFGRRYGMTRNLLHRPVRVALAGCGPR